MAYPRYFLCEEEGVENPSGAASVAAPSSNETNFAEIAAFSDEGELGESDEGVSAELPTEGVQVRVPQPKQPAPVVEMPKPAAQPTATPAAVPAAPVPAAAAPAKAPDAPQPASSPTAAQPVSVPVITEEARKQYTEARNNALVNLEKAYAVSEEDAVALATEPENVLPKMAARILADAFEMQQMQIQQFEARLSQIFPQLIERYQSTAATTKAQREAFFSEWPELNDPKYAQTVAAVAQTYMQHNPNASLADQVRAIGQMSAVALGLNPQPKSVPVAAPPSVVAVPPPHHPAGTGASAPARPTNGAPNIFEALAMQEDIEDI